MNEKQTQITKTLHSYNVTFISNVLNLWKQIPILLQAFDWIIDYGEAYLNKHSHVNPEEAESLLKEYYDFRSRAKVCISFFYNWNDILAMEPSVFLDTEMYLISHILRYLTLSTLSGLFHPLYWDDLSHL